MDVKVATVTNNNIVEVHGTQTLFQHTKDYLVANAM